MHDDEDRPPRVPAPRQGGRDDDGHPVIPTPRSVPALECLPRPAGAVVTMIERPAPDQRVPSSALVRTECRSTALAVRETTVVARLRSWGRDVARVVVGVVGAALHGLRSLVGSFVACPTAR